MEFNHCKYPQPEFLKNFEFPLAFLARLAVN